MSEFRRRLLSIRKKQEGGGDSLLPDGYIQVEYIESTGTQYIDGLLLPNSSYSYKITFKKTEYSSANGRFFGLRNDNKYVIAISCNATKFELITSFDGDRINYSISNFDTKKHTIYIKRNEVYFDGQKTNDIKYTANVQSSLSYHLFRHNDPNSSLGVYTLYGVEICDYNDIVLQKLIPCINPSGEVGMYDTINKRFLGNSGTGEFIAGPIVDWIGLAHNKYGIPVENLKAAYDIDPNIKKTFDGSGRWLLHGGDTTARIDTGITLSDFVQNIDIEIQVCVDDDKEYNIFNIWGNENSMFLDIRKISSNNSIICYTSGSGTQKNLADGMFFANGLHTITIKNGVQKIDNVIVDTNIIQNPVFGVLTRHIYIPTRIYGWTVVSDIYNPAKFGLVKIQDKVFIPIFVDNKVKCLDIMSMTYPEIEKNFLLQE